CAETFIRVGSSSSSRSRFGAIRKLGLTPAPFELERGEHAQRRVTPVWVVPALDVVEDTDSGRAPAKEGGAVEQLALQAGEEGLAEGVVVGIAPAAHGGEQACLPQMLPKVIEVYCPGPDPNGGPRRAQFVGAEAPCEGR